MKKFLFVLLLPCFIFANAVGGGTNIIDVGLTGVWKNGFGIAAEFEHGINNMFTAGGGADIWFNDKIGVGPKGRFMWHPFGVPSWNPSVANTLDWYLGPQVHFFFFDGFNGYFSLPMGVRYFVKNSLAIWGEFGWQSAHLGVTFKL